MVNSSEEINIRFTIVYGPRKDISHSGNSIYFIKDLTLVLGSRIMLQVHIKGHLK